MNSYFKAIKRATSNGRFTDLGDLWRVYHSTANLSDSDYSLFSQTPPRASSSDRANAAGEGVKKLYVPVTRKVSLADETFSLPSNHVYF